MSVECFGKQYLLSRPKLRGAPQLSPTLQTANMKVGYLHPQSRMFYFRLIFSQGLFHSLICHTHKQVPHSDRDLYACFAHCECKIETFFLFFSYLCMHIERNSTNHPLTSSSSFMNKHLG